MDTAMPRGRLTGKIDADISLNGQTVRISMEWVDNMHSPFIDTHLKHDTHAANDMRLSVQQPYAWLVFEILMGALINFCWDTVSLGTITLQDLGEAVRQCIIDNQKAFSGA